MLGQNKKVSEKKTTTVVGLITIATAVIPSLLPKETWETCSAAVLTSANPMLTGTLLVAGLGLTIYGPSIAKK